MKAAETNLRGLLEGGKQYIIPIFQRPYSWEKKNWETLWEDILDLYSSYKGDGLDSSHFLGPIVTVAQIGTPDGVSPYIVIDGQQRLVTLSVLLAALRDQMKENGVSEKFVDALHNLYVINQYKEGDHQFKILPTKTDIETYQQITLKKSIESGLLFDAYNFFVRQLRRGDPESQTSIDLAKLQSILLESLVVVHITLDKKDNPYLIFESLNYKGTPLTQADLVRNYFFMHIPNRKKQNELYDDVWYPVQKNFEESARLDGKSDYLDELTDAFWYYLRKDRSRVGSAPAVS